MASVLIARVSLKTDLTNNIRIGKYSISLKKPKVYRVLNYMRLGYYLVLNNGNPKKIIAPAVQANG